jgi:RNA polymerase sigma factor (sigma-70 family)
VIRDSKILNELWLIYLEDRSEQNFLALHKKLDPLLDNYFHGNFKNINHTNLIDIKGAFYHNMLSAIDQFDKNLPFINWAITIFKNQCLLYLRNRLSGSSGFNHGHNIFFKNIEFSEYSRDSKYTKTHREDFDFSLKTSNNNIEDWIEREYMEFAIPAMNNALDKMDPMYRELFEDRYILGMSHDELIEKYKWNRNTLKTRIRKSLLDFKKILFPSENVRKLSRSQHRSVSRRNDKTS